MVLFMRFAALAVTSCVAGSGCLVANYSWVQAPAQASDAGSTPDAAPIDSAGPGGLAGVVNYPTGPGTPPSNERPILRVWLAAVGSADAGCPPLPAWPPTYHQDINPAPDSGSYEFADVEPGPYCLTVVLDEPPFFAPGESPSCNDPRSPAMAIMIPRARVTAPTTTLEFPNPCP